MKMCPSTLLLLILPTFINLLDFSIAQDQSCSPASDYCWNCSTVGTSSSKYKENLDTLLSSISSSGSKTNLGFYNTSLGESNNRVNAIALCRGDLVPDECQSCLKNSSSRLLENCPSKMEAILWDERCMIRYSDKSIFSIKKDEPIKMLSSPNKASDAQQFKLVLNPLLDDLKTKAASGDSLRKYAFDNATVPNAGGIYALLQCTPDLKKQDCEDCLEEAISHIPQCCDGRTGARILKPSCNLRYESGQFYGTKASPTTSGCSKNAEYCWSCSDPSIESSTRSYSGNLNNLLSSISSNNIPNGFYNSSLGEYPNRVNVIALCRGDIPEQKCTSGLNATSQRLLENCPNKKEAIIWDELCMVRYSNNSIFSIKKDEPIKMLSSPNKASDAQQFKLVLNPLLDDLKTKAASGDSLRKYAFDNATVPNAEGIYALLQCTPDLKKQDCEDCLEEAISHIPQCCDGMTGARILKPSCNLRYESGQFYETKASPTTTGCSKKAEYCWSCSDPSIESSTRSYSENLNNLLSSISSNNIPNGFYNSSLGEYPNRVNVIALCRGDIPEQNCTSCLNTTSQRLLENCPNKKEAIIWDELCMVRYSNNSIFSVKMDEPSKYLQSPSNATEPNQFKLVLNPLLDGLSSKASSGDSLKKFASGSAKVPGYETIYATAQCTPDLDQQECANCLQESVSSIPQCCDGKQGARVLKPSCNLRYEVNSFYVFTNNSSESPPSNSPVSPPSNEGNKSKTGSV